MADDVAKTELVFDATGARRGADDFRSAAERVIASNRAVEQSLASQGAALDKMAQRADPLRRVASAGDDTARSFQALEARSTKLNEQLDRLNDTQSMLLQQFVTFGAVSSPAYALVTTAIVGASAAADLLYLGVKAASKEAAAGAGSIAAWVSGIATGGLSERFTPELLAYAAAVDAVSMKLGVASGGLHTMAVAQTALKTSGAETVAIYQRIGGALTTVTSEALAAREAAAVLGVDLTAFRDDQIPEALDAIAAALGRYRDGAQKTKLVRDIFGYDAPTFLQNLSRAQQVATDDVRDHADATALLMSRQAQYTKELADLQAELDKPGWFGRQIEAVQEFFTVSQRFKDNQALILQEAGRSWSEFWAKLKSGALDFENAWQSVVTTVHGTITNITGDYQRGSVPADQRQAPALTPGQRAEGLNFLGALDPAIAANMRFNDTMEKAAQLFDEGKLSAAEYARAVRMIEQAAAAAADPLDKFLTNAAKKNALYATPQGQARARAGFLQQARDAAYPNAPDLQLDAEQRRQAGAVFDAGTAGAAGDAGRNAAVQLASLRAQSTAALSSASAVERLKAEESAYQAIIAGSPLPKHVLVLNALEAAEQQRRITTATTVRQAAADISMQMAVSEGYRRSTADGIRAEAVERRIVDAKEQRIAAGTAELVAQSDLDKAAQAAIASGDAQLAGLRDQIAAQDGLVAATARGGATLVQFNATQRATAETAKAMATAIASGNQAAIDQVQRLRTALAGAYVDQAGIARDAKAANDNRLQEQQLAELQLELSLMGQGVTLRAQEVALLKLRNQLINEGYDGEALDNELEKRKAITQEIAKTGVQLDLAKERERDMRQAANDFSKIVGTAFEDAVINGKKFSDVIAGLTKDIAQLIMRVGVTKPLQNMLQGALEKKDLGSLFGGGGGGGSFWDSLFGGGGGAGGGDAGAGDLLGGIAFAANGAVLSRGNIIPFARGGVVNRPTVFPMANGGVGLMGEAGDEAVMPLTRLPGGRLGVDSAGGGGRGHTITQNIAIDARGADAAVDRRIRAAVEDSRRKTLQQVQALNDRGGNFAKKSGRRR